MAQKVLFCFIKISGENLLPILGYSFYSQCHILAKFCQMLLLFNTSKLIAQKLLFFGTKTITVIVPWSHIWGLGGLHYSLVQLRPPLLQAIALFLSIRSVPNGIEIFVISQSVCP
jgi:hypothetical protein